MKRIVEFVLIIGTVFVFGGCCTSLVLPKDQTNFPGIAELATNSRLPGPLRLFMIHGMSPHPTNWGEDYLNPLARKLGAGWKLVPPGEEHPLQWSGQSNTFVGNVTVYQLKDRGMTRIVVYQLTWSSLTGPFKDERFKTDLAAWRPAVNQAVRNVVDENLSDVVLYLSGFDNEVLNKTVQIALTNFYNGAWDPETETKAAIPNSPVAVITESLGSLMFVDGLRALAADDKTDEPLTRFFKNAQMVFMMANQLNLLEMPSPEPSGPVPQPAGLAANDPAQRPKSIRAFLRMRYNAMHPGTRLASRKDEQTKMRPPESGSSPFFFVAFNDPYDVLSYQVTKDDVAEYADVQWVAIDNFAPRNACDWFWLYESPAQAHDGYRSNPHVINVVVNGYHQGKNPLP